MPQFSVKTLIFGRFLNGKGAAGEGDFWGKVTLSYASFLTV